MAEGLRKTYKEKLRPTPAQKQELELVLWRCRTLYKRRAGAAHHRLAALPRLRLPL
jgi:hypothetical protein